MNGSHAPELTDLLKEITEDIAKYVIKEGKPIILMSILGIEKCFL